MTMLAWVAIGLAVAALYPFGAGLTYRACGYASRPTRGCGCWVFCNPWKLVPLVWPLYWLARGVFWTAYTMIHALAYAPRAMFRLGAGTLRPSQTPAEKFTEALRAIDAMRGAS